MLFWVLKVVIVMMVIKVMHALVNQMDHASLGNFLWPSFTVYIILNLQSLNRPCIVDYRGVVSKWVLCGVQ